MTQRLDFVEDFARGLYSMSELCAHYTISRRVGYKWWERYRVLGPAGLVDHRRTPHQSPTRTAPELVALLLAARRAHPTWGPRKLLPYLERRHPGREWPVPSTVRELLKRAGLVRGRPRRRPVGHPGRSRRWT